MRTDMQVNITVPKDLSCIQPLIIEDLVRVGGECDGGYVIPLRNIALTDYLISCGINDDWSFEEQFLLLNPNIYIHAYDHTISQQIFKKNIVKSIRRFLRGCGSLSLIFNKIKLEKKYNKFFKPPVTHYKERVYFPAVLSDDADFKKIFNRVPPNKSAFIKIDIEGGEYRVVDDLLDKIEHINGLVIEFHDVGVLRATFIESIVKLKRHFYIVHIHINNAGGLWVDGFPDALEITFSKKDLVVESALRTVLPIENLDAPNIPGNCDYRLCFEANI